MEQKRSHFLDGLLIGTVIGGAAVFLLGTKKGREIFRIIKNEGMDRFGKIEDMFHEYQDIMGEEIADDIDGVKEKVSSKEEKVKSPLRRKLFKGLSRKK